MSKKSQKKVLGVIAAAALLFGGPAYAGGDNRVSMTDMKEALFSLILESRKSNEALEALSVRLANVEPSVKDTESNTRAVAAMIARLNQLGVPSTTRESDELDKVISSYVEENMADLPKAAVGVR